MTGTEGGRYPLLCTLENDVDGVGPQTPGARTTVAMHASHFSVVLEEYEAHGCCVHRRGRPTLVGICQILARWIGIESLRGNHRLACFMGLEQLAGQ